MPFSNEDKAPIENSYQFKEYGSQNLLMEFSKTKLQKGNTGHVTKRILETGNTDQRQTETCA